MGLKHKEVLNRFLKIKENNKKSMPEITVQSEADSDKNSLDTET
jgi:hypothetical protein